MSAATRQPNQQDGSASDSAQRDREAAGASGQKVATGTVPVAQRAAIYTMTAQAGLEVADLVNAAFGTKTIGAVTPRRVELVAPDGPSTAGGKRARQTIRLVPVAAEGFPVMCGYLDAARKRVELRSYRSVEQQYEQRFGASFDVSRAEYAALCKELEITLGAFRYSFTHDSEPPQGPAQAGRAQLSTGRAKVTADLGGKRARLLNIVVLSLALAIAAGVALAMILR